MFNKKQLMVIWSTAGIIALQDIFILFYRDASGARFISTRYILLWAVPVLCLAIPLIFSMADRGNDLRNPLPPWNGIERRRSPRTSKERFRIEYRIYSREDVMLKGDWQKSVVQDISKGGLRFISTQKYKPHDILELHIKMYSAEGDLHCFARTLRIMSGPEKNMYFVSAQFIDKNE